MGVKFERTVHPHVAARRARGAPKAADKAIGFNGRLAITLTTIVGTMWCAYAFGVLALVALPQAIAKGDPITIVQWISQTFIQLVMLSVIMVGQNLISAAADKRAELTYKDAEATFHEAEQIQAHLAAQDEALNGLLEKVAALEQQLEAKR